VSPDVARRLPALAPLDRRAGLARAMRVIAAGQLIGSAPAWLLAVQISTFWGCWIKPWGWAG